jgi:hypothetical protein
MDFTIHIGSLTIRLTINGTEWSGTWKQKEKGLILAFKEARKASIDLEYQWTQAV